MVSIAITLFCEASQPAATICQCITLSSHEQVQPDAVCEVGGSTPGLSHGDLGIFLGGGQRNLYIS